MDYKLSDSLKKEVRKVFEPRYKRKLTDAEVFEIAENLTGFMEVVLKMKWEQSHTKIGSKDVQRLTKTLRKILRLKNTPITTVF